MKGAVFIASTLLLATAANAAMFLCGLSEDKFMPAIECLHQNVGPEVASYLGRLPEKGAEFVRMACKANVDVDEILRSVWTEDFVMEIAKADKACEGKF